jgi:hypothetical protein
VAIKEPIAIQTEALNKPHHEQDRAVVAGGDKLSGHYSTEKNQLRNTLALINNKQFLI